MADKPMRADARRNREAIVVAARAAFADGGGDIRFDDFAELAGVGVGTLYRHFPTREALAAAVFQDEAYALADRARVLRQNLPPIEALSTHLHEFVTYLDTHQGLARTLVSTTVPDVTAEGGRAVEAAISDLVTRAAAAAVIRHDITAGAVLIALHGIAGSLGRPGWRTDAHDLVDLMIGGLAVAPAPASSAGEGGGRPASPGPRP